MIVETILFTSELPSRSIPSFQLVLRDDYESVLAAISLSLFLSLCLVSDRVCRATLTGKKHTKGTLLFHGPNSIPNCSLYKLHSIPHCVFSTAL